MDVIYDWQCGFCVRSVRFARALDVRGVLRYHDATDRADVHRRFPELAAADFDNAMFAVSPSRRAYRGFFAVRRMARAVPLMWPFLTLLYFPGSGWLGPKVYAWVARNRRRFGCESDVCALPPSDSSRKRIA